MRFRISYDILKQPKLVLITTALVVVIYNTLFYFHPSNQSWLSDGHFSWSNFLQYLLLEQYMIEIITTLILFLLIRLYAQRLNLIQLDLNPKAIASYLAKFLPLFLLAFFVFNPITQSTRYFLNEHDNLSQQMYFNEYVFNWSLYPVYLIPTFLTGYGVLIYIIVITYNKGLSGASADIERLKTPQKYKTRLNTQDDWGEVPIETHQILWFEKEDRKYFAQTRKSRLRTRETLTELESSLDPDKFVRINRSVIVNVRAILNYSYWENEKYILRLNDEKQTEFVMSRDRLKKVKAQLQLK